MAGPDLEGGGKNCRGVRAVYFDKHYYIGLLHDLTAEGAESTKMSNPAGHAVDDRRGFRPGRLGKKSLTFKVDDL